MPVPKRAQNPKGAHKPASEPPHLANAARVLQAILAQRDPSRSWTVTVLPSGAVRSRTASEIEAAMD
jgi:hypothetical protein